MHNDEIISQHRAISYGNLIKKSVCFSKQNNVEKYIFSSKSCVKKIIMHLFFLARSAVPASSSPEAHDVEHYYREKIIRESGSFPTGETIRNPL